MVEKTYPKQGEIILLDFSPTEGHEQSGYRPALVISNSELNAKLGVCTVVPVTTRIRGIELEIPLKTKKREGVILTHHLRTIDYKSRPWKKVDSVDTSLVKTTLHMINEMCSLD
jgi:mRNA interferase MazF